MRLTQGEIEALERRHRQIEDVLPLAPLQEGLLFHALYDANWRDVYTVQLVLDLAGALDEELLKASAQALVSRHASLRAAFHHESLTRPVQVVVPQVTVPWRSFDLSQLDDEARAERMGNILERDRDERFDLGSPPLIRFTLLRPVPHENGRGRQSDDGDDYDYGSCFHCRMSFPTASSSSLKLNW